MNTTKMKKNSWIKSNWTISIGTAIFSLLLTIIYDYSKQKPILTTIWNIIKWIGNIVWEILDFDLKVWWLLIAIIIIILILFFITKFQKEENFNPDFHNYKEDKLKKWKWSWNWEYSKQREAWVISDMKAHCPNCDTPLIDHSSTFGYCFSCPRCNFEARDGQCDEPYKIERIILDNINRKRRTNNL